MNSKQRKAHQYIWILLILAVPIIIIFSIKDLSILSLENEKILTHNESKEAPINSFENDLVQVVVYQKSIKTILKRTLKNASSIVYATDNKGNRLHVIGQLTTTGIYNFSTENLPKGIVIYDELKNIEITKFLFKWD